MRIRHFIIFLIAMLTATTAMAVKYKIVALNTPTINIGGRTLRTGDVFEPTEKIEWSSEQQAMKVKSDNKKIYVISGQKFNRRKYHTFRDFLVNIKPTNVRAIGLYDPIEDLREIAQDDYILLDTIRFDVGLTESGGYISAAVSSGNSGTVVLPHDGTTFFIDRSVIGNLSPCTVDSVRLTLYYHEAETNDSTVITDDMYIQIVSPATAQTSSMRMNGAQ